MVKKKEIKKSSKKKKATKKSKRKSSIEKVYGEPSSVKPVREYYSLKSNEIYPKIFFRKDTMWDKVKRFFGYIP